MNWQWATLLATVMIQLIFVAVAYGKFDQRIADNEKRVGLVEEVQIDHGKRLSAAEATIRETAAYQQGMKDATEHHRNRV